MKNMISILLVEDNPNDVELTLHAFAEYRPAHCVQVARDGQEALDYLFCQGEHAQRCQTDFPQLVLLDLKLPKIGGLEVLQRMKSEPRLYAVPVVVLTTSSEERDIKESYRLGVNSYIVKPVDFDEFTELAHTVWHYWLQSNRLPGQTQDR